MPLICIASPKGGVGKTTLTAGLAFALQRLGLPVTVIDFDVQNALRLHFAVALGDLRGYVAHAEQSDWRRLALQTSGGIGLLPYGMVGEAQRLRFEALLAETQGFLEEALRGILSIPRMVVLADTPPGPSPALNALNAIADVRIAVLLADAASVSLLPQIEQGFFYVPQATRSPLPVLYIINQVDRRRRLSADTTELMRARLQGSLLGLVHRDEALAEALASQQSIFAFDPSSAAAHDLDTIARRLGRLLGDLEPHASGVRRQG
ncbi:cellulose biosynthesis protein BcsQ [Azotobacter vinelandii]